MDNGAGVQWNIFAQSGIVSLAEPRNITCMRSEASETQNEKFVECNENCSNIKKIAIHNDIKPIQK